MIIYAPHKYILNAPRVLREVLAGLKAGQSLVDGALNSFCNRTGVTEPAMASGHMNLQAAVGAYEKFPGNIARFFFELSECWPPGCRAGGFLTHEDTPFQIPVSWRQKSAAAVR
jgi:hypothetical protein